MPSNKYFPAILQVLDFIGNVEPDPTRPGKGLSIQLRVSLNIPSQDIHSDDVEQNEIPAPSGSLMRATGLIFINQMLLSIRQVLFLQPRLRMKGFILFFTLTIWIGRFAFSISGTCLYSLVTLVIRKIQPHTLCTVPELLSQ